MHVVPDCVQKSTQEAVHQRWIAKWLRFHNKTFTAPANGTHSTTASRNRASREGMENGAPDLLIFEPRHGFGGLGIEMKRPRGMSSRVSEDQLAFHRRLRACNWMVEVCYGAQEALDLLRWWFNAPQWEPAVREERAEQSV